MAVAIFIKSESGDSYLYCFENEENPKERAASLCPEYPEHWSEIIIQESF